MAWIELPADDATPELERFTCTWRDRGDPLPAVLAIMKPNLGTLKAVNRMNGAVTFGGSSLGRRREELVSAAVSALNDCFY